MLLVYPAYTILVESIVIAADAVISVSPKSSRGDPTTGDPGTAGSVVSTLPRAGVNWHTFCGYMTIAIQ